MTARSRHRTPRAATRRDTTRARQRLRAIAHDPRLLMAGHALAHRLATLGLSVSEPPLPSGKEDAP